MRSKWIYALLLCAAATIIAFERNSSFTSTSSSTHTPAAVSTTTGSDIDSGLSVFFSPNGGCESAVVEQLSKAVHTVDLQAYSFTNKHILQALVDAKHRGVKLRLILDKSNETDHYSGATFMINHGIPVLIDDEHAIAHNKIIIIDGKTVLTGSFNFTAAAEQRNAENLLIITGNSPIAAAYARNFTDHLAHSKPYAAPAKKD